MAYTTLYKDIIFIEGNSNDVRVIGNVSSDLSFKFGAQLKNLNDVKNDMADKAKSLGANCIVNFTYGQKSRWFAIDDVAFYGKGEAAILPSSIYDEVTAKIKNR